MTRPVSRAVVEKFYGALEHRDIDTMTQCLADDVVWTINGPVDLLPYCGRRAGKAMVLSLLKREIPALLGRRRFITDAILVDGDRAAILGKLAGAKPQDGHAIVYRLAQFLRFRDDRLIEYVSIIDSFDAVEQVLGHAIDLPDGRAAEGNLIAV